MPSHKVILTLPAHEMSKADATFKVHSDGDMLGTLEVSKGSLVWFPPNTTYGLKVGWEKFAQMMDENATRFEKR